MTPDRIEDLAALALAYALGAGFLSLGYILAGHVWVERHSIHLPGPGKQRRISGLWGELFLFTACAAVVVTVRMFTDIAIVRDVLVAHLGWAIGVFVAVVALILIYSSFVVRGARTDGKDAAYRGRLRNAYGAYAFYCAILFAGGIMVVALLGVEFAHDQRAFDAQREIIAQSVSQAQAAATLPDPAEAARLSITHMEDAIGEISMGQNLLQDQMNPVFIFAAVIFAVNILIVLSPIRSAFMQGAVDLTHILTAIAVGGILIAGFVSYFLSYSQVIENTLARMESVRPAAELGLWEISQRYNEMIVQLNRSRNLLGFVQAIGGEGSGLALFAAAIQITVERLPARTDLPATQS